MATYKRYSDEDKAGALAVLDANGNNLKRTSKETGIPASTLKRWRIGQVSEGVTDLRPQKALELAQLIEDELRAVFDEMKTKRKDAFYSQLATAAGIFIDKKQLLEGKATERKELTGKNGGAIETKVTLLSELSDDELDHIIDHPATSQRRESAPSPST